jgi:3-isopropylmalate/(R)-2-methylmalate dehydratase small subunit
MDKITAFGSKLIPMLIANVDTDQIIPAQYVSSRTTAEFAHALFRNRRDRDPGFVLDQPAMRGRSVILAGPNFGCGSSREAAPWALVAGGIRAVVSTGFGDIFNNNSLKNGLLPIVVSEAEHERLRTVVADDPDVEVTVDLPSNTLSVPAQDISIELRIDPFYRQLLVSGMDELDYLLSHVADIERYEDSDAVHPTTRANRAAGRQDR